MEKSVTSAVLTGDIVGSTDLTPERRQQLQARIERTFQEIRKLIPGFRADQYRGDSFQAVTEARLSLKALLLIYALLRIEGFGVRIALGLGEITFDSGNVLTSDGSAFHLSGTGLDDLKKRNQPVSVLGLSNSFNKEWRVHSLALGFLLQRWTLPQAEAVLGQLRGFTQEETARQLHVRQPAIQQRLQSAGWPVIEAIVERFETSIHADLL